MTDRYAELRAALDAATPGPWEWSTEICERGPVGKGNTIRVSLSAPRNSHAHARTAVLAPNWNTSEGDVWQAWISCNEANAAYIAACHPEAIRALLAERDALKGLLAELVACEDIKQRIAIEQATMIPETDDDLIELDRLMTDLARRKPKAWEAARAALAQENADAE